MFTILEAVLPIFLLVLLGVIFKRKQFPAEGFWVKADRITYFVFLPVLLVEKLATTAFTLDDFYSLTVVLIVVILAMAVFIVLIRKFLNISPASFTSVFQGSIRPNTYVALAAAAALFGPKGLALTAIVMAGVIPLVNILCVTSFSYYVPNKDKKQSLLKNIISNPLVIACAIGVLLNVTGIGLPYVSLDLFQILSSAALPMGLISVGYGLQIKGSREHMLPSFVAATLKLIAMPLITYYLLTFMEIDDIRRSVAVLFSAVPCAVSSYILAGHLNGDKELMATIITVETLASFITMPLVLALAI